MRASKTVNGVKHEYYYVDGLLKTEKIGDDYEMHYRYDTNGVLASVTRYTVSTDASSESSDSVAIKSSPGGSN